MAGMGTRRVRIANLRLETPDEALSFAFSQYGEIKETQRLVWSKTSHYKVFNGVRTVVITLTTHSLSYIIIAGHRELSTCMVEVKRDISTTFAPRGE